MAQSLQICTGKKPIISFPSWKIIVSRPTKPTDKSSIQIQKGKGCWSLIGKSNRKIGPQVISVGSGCEHVGIVMHEFMHAAGFWHEQSRIDRDTYITVHLSNAKNNTQNQFRKYESHEASDLQAPYDICSIMHYGKFSFTKNGEPTITVNEGYGKPKCTIGNRKGFTETDK